MSLRRLSCRFLLSVLLAGCASQPAPPGAQAPAERLAQLDLPTAPPPDPGHEPHGLGSLIRRVARRR